MDAILNPKSSAAILPVFAIALIAAGTLLSWSRLKTVAIEKRNNDLAISRTEMCRILANHQRVELGAYYFQPTTQKPDGTLEGALLNEGAYICDVYGVTARIERGGYAQFVVTATDLTGYNRQLRKRLSDESNPDSSEMSRIRRATNMGIHRERPQEAPDQFFNLQ